MRDIKKQAQQGRAIIRKHDRADLTVGELRRICDDFTAAAEKQGVYNALIDAVTNSYYMGVAVGSRNV